PRDRVVGAHRAVAGVVRRLVQGRQDVDVAARVLAVVVPLVGTVPRHRQVVGGGVHVVDDVHVGVGRSRRVAGEVGADELAVPGPVVLGVARGVDAGVTAAVLDVSLEGGLLLIVEHVAGGGEPDDDV